MNDELPPVFQRLTPCPAPSELRERVLAAVDRRLADPSPAITVLPGNGSRRVAPWERAAELMVAACLLLGVGMNAWQWRSEPAWQARVYGAPVVSDAVAALSEAVASVTDSQVARAVIERLPKSTAHAADESAFARDYQKLLDELSSPKGSVL